MCKLNTMIAHFASLENNTDVDMIEVWKNLSKTTEFDVMDVASELDIDYTQVCHIFTPHSTNQAVKAGRIPVNAGNALSVLMMFKMLGVVTWEMVNRFDVDPDEFITNITDLKNKVDQSRQERDAKSRIMRFLDQKGISLSKLGLEIRSS